jgi:hypothetical protein
MRFVGQFCDPLASIAALDCAIDYVFARATSGALLAHDRRATTCSVHHPNHADLRDKATSFRFGSRKSWRSTSFYCKSIQLLDATKSAPRHLKLHLDAGRDVYRVEVSTTFAGLRESVTIAGLVARVRDAVAPSLFVDIRCVTPIERILCGEARRSGILSVRRELRIAARKRLDAAVERAIGESRASLPQPSDVLALAAQGLSLVVADLVTPTGTTWHPVVALTPRPDARTEWRLVVRQPATPVLMEPVQHGGGVTVLMNADGERVCADTKLLARHGRGTRRLQLVALLCGCEPQATHCPRLGALRFPD